jgi:hypothetical protein
LTNRGLLISFANKRVVGVFWRRVKKLLNPATRYLLFATQNTNGGKIKTAPRKRLSTAQL